MGFPQSAPYHPYFEPKGLIAQREMETWRLSNGPIHMTL